MPPSSGETRLARPWPNSSRSGSWRVETLIASATVADSRLSSAASAATATAGSDEHPQLAPRHRRHGEGEQLRGERADRRHRQVGQPRHDRGPHDGQQGDRHRGAQPGAEQDQHGHPGAEGQRRRGRAPRTSRPPRPTADTTTCSCWAVVPERGRHLLQGDQGGDAEGEPLDDRQRDEAHVAAGAGQPHRDEERARHQPHDGHPAGAVLGHDRHEHDGHRAGRAGDLHVAAAEDRRHDPGDDRGHQAGGGAEPRRDAEGQGQGEGDHPDRHAGDDVGARGWRSIARRSRLRGAPHGIEAGAHQVEHLGAGARGAHQRGAGGDVVDEAALVGGLGLEDGAGAREQVASRPGGRGE